MSSADLKRDKRRVRNAVRAERDAVPTDVREERAARVIERFLDLPEVQRARTIMLFSSFGSEIPTGSLIERLQRKGVVVALPRIEGAELVPVPYAPGDPTTTTSFGAEEPDGPAPASPGPAPALSSAAACW